MPVSKSAPRPALRTPALPDLSLRTKLAAVVVVAVLVLTVGMLGTFAVRDYRAAGALVVRTRDVQQELAAVLQRLTDAETGQRGYLLTGAEVFLDPYNGAKADVTSALNRLRELTMNDGAQRRRLDTLLVEAGNRSAYLDERIMIRRAGGSVTLDELRTGKAGMDSVRATVASMDVAATMTLLSQTAAADREGSIAIAVMLIGSMAAFGLLLLINAAIKRDVEQRELARARIEEQNAELEMQSHTLADQQVELEAQLEEAQVMSEELALANDEYGKLTAVAESARASSETAFELYRATDRRYQFLADTIPVQVWTATPRGELDFVSKGVVEYFGKPSEEVIGAGWLGVLHPDDVDPVVERWTHSLATGELYEVNFRLLRRDGVFRWHLGRAIAQRDDAGNVALWFGSNTDIDDQYRQREERERLMTALERTNSELDQFAYVASHDLKAPLRGIANLSQWIEEDSGDDFPAESRHKMVLLRGRVHRLEGLIDGILEYSRAGRTQAPAVAIDVNALVREAVEMLDPSSTTRVNIVGTLPSVVTEVVPLTQVFSNLIGNAIKYSARADTEVRIEAHHDRTYVHFSVTDNGPGIAAQYHERIFVVFQTLAARDKVEGTGIGLAIVKKIVEARGGRVWVESPADATLGIGATFHFTWPKSPVREQ